MVFLGSWTPESALRYLFHNTRVLDDRQYNRGFVRCTVYLKGKYVHWGRARMSAPITESCVQNAECAMHR